MLRTRVKVKASGTENLSALKPPFLFVSNHQGYLDVPVILKALPFLLQRQIAPAMGTDRTKFEQYSAALFFNTYPLPGDSIGLKQALERTGELVDQGYSPLVFPEGKMTEDGKLQPFRPGIGVIAKQIQLPVIPILLRGVFEIWPVTAQGPAKGIAEVKFGHPLQFAGKEPAEITAILESWYHKQTT
jgi:long-chain acyl-CoA synthetase